ncbi:MAG: hypothetical protein ACW99A_09730 [Candidatus Kariarchaeaceae archaeon]|jgi:hypothetical protein
MTNEYLTFKNMTIVQAVLLLLYGIAFILMPQDTLSFYDVSISDDGDFITKLWGAAFISIAIIVWAIRDMEFSDIRKNISIGLLVGSGLGTILSLMNRFNDNTNANALEWLNVLLYGVFTVGYAYFTFIETGETKSSASE